MAESKTNFNVRVDKELKNSFIRAAKKQDIDASKLIRQYMREYIAKHERNTVVD